MSHPDDLTKFGDKLAAYRDGTRYETTGYASLTSAIPQAVPAKPVTFAEEVAKAHQALSNIEANLTSLKLILEGPQADAAHGSVAREAFPEGVFGEMRRLNDRLGRLAVEVALLRGKAGDE